MSDAILTFQVQLSGVMETVLKSAMYEITRLVEDSFLEEVARSKQEVESLRQRLQWSESRRREREGGGRSRCADCGRAAVSSEDTEDRPSGAQSGPEGASALCERLSEREWSPGPRQDTAPSSGRLPPEQQSAGETYGLRATGSEHVAHGLLLSGAQRRNHPDCEPGPWTEFKWRDVDDKTDGLDPSYAADPPAHTQPPPAPAEEGPADIAPPAQRLAVKSEGGVAVKEEFDTRPVCGEEGGWDVAHARHRRHRDTWDTGETQVENAGPSPPAQDAIKRLQSFSDRVDSLTLQLRQRRRHGPPDRNPKTNVSEIAAEPRLEARDADGGASRGQDLMIVSNDVQARQRSRAAEKPFSCVQCRKSFTQRKNLQAHLKQHAGERPHRCTQCGKSFLYLSRLKIHVLGHTGERPFGCAHCEKGFLSFYDLKVHQRNHTGEKPYSCAQCGKCFTRLSILKEHRIIHSKEKSFCCVQCGKRFARPSNLKAHLRRHVVAKPHSCTLCGKSFLYLCRLKKHQKKFHWTEAN